MVFGASSMGAAASNDSPMNNAGGDDFALSSSQQFHFGALPEATFAAADSRPTDHAPQRDTETRSITDDFSLGLKPDAKYSPDVVEAHQRQLAMLLLLIGSYASAVTIVLSWCAAHVGPAHAHAPAGLG